MPVRYVISATGTDVGKTLAASILMLGLNTKYWKPVQCGAEPETDTQTVKRLTGLPDDRFLPEAHIFGAPLSPHRAAEIEKKEIDVCDLCPPDCKHPLLIEGAGGLMVPLSRTKLFLDLFAHWHLPLILCARTELGTINHTLLSINAVRAHDIPLHGVLFLGPENTDTVKTISEFGKARILGHIPPLTDFSKERLKAVFTERLDPAMFPL